MALSLKMFEWEQVWSKKRVIYIKFQLYSGGPLGACVENTYTQ